MDSSRVVIIYTLEHAHAALSAASELNKPIILQSAPGALFYTGALYLQNMFEQAKKAYPKADATFIIDCEDASAEAISAMHVGHRDLRSSASATIQAKLVDIAKWYAATIVTGPYDKLDLLQVKEPKEACYTWLNNHPTKAATSPSLKKRSG